MNKKILEIIVKYLPCIMAGAILNLITKNIFIILISIFIWAVLWIYVVNKMIKEVQAEAITFTVNKTKQK